MSIRNYQDLVAWQKSMDLAVAIYDATAGFPREERYGLTTQLRRASVSVPSNIAEGQGRGSDPQFRHLLSVAHGSVRELETQLMLAERLGFIQETACGRLLDAAGEVGRLVTGLKQAMRPAETA